MESLPHLEVALGAPVTTGLTNGMPRAIWKNIWNEPKEEIDYEKHTYKERHLVENFFQFIKRFRRIGTRYEMHAQNFREMIAIGCILQWVIF